jgi:hypothetical protein
MRRKGKGGIGSNQDSKRIDKWEKYKKKRGKGHKIEKVDTIKMMGIALMFRKKHSPRKLGFNGRKYINIFLQSNTYFH